jgi:hypothetical protein
VAGTVSLSKPHCAYVAFCELAPERSDVMALGQFVTILKMFAVHKATDELDPMR